MTPGAVPSLPLHDLPRVVAAVTVASVGSIALLFFLFDRTRREVALYTALAFGVAAHLGLPVAYHLPSWLDPLAVRRLVAFHAGAVPVVGYLFLLRFGRFPFAAARIVLAVVCGLAAVGGAAAPEPWLTRLEPLPLALVLVLVGDVLFACALRSRRQRTDESLLFVGTASLLLGALADAATAAGILPLPPIPLLGPAFLVFTAFLLATLSAEGRRLFTRATVDALTNLLNRGAFLDRATQEIVRAERTGRPVALVMLDIDHFKSFNDRYGHQTGDRVLSGAAQAVARTIRGIDLAGRYGGEEFIVLLVEAEEEPALVAVERIRAAISQMRLPGVKDPVTASAGVAVHHGLFERARVSDLIRRADAALYESKRGGRDRTTLEKTRSEAPATVAEVRYR